MSRDRLRELIKKHKEVRNERNQKRNVEQFFSDFESLNTVAPTPKPDLSNSDQTNFRLVLQQALQDNPTPVLKRNPFTPLVMPDKLNSIVSEESILLNENNKTQTPLPVQTVPQTPKPVVPQTPLPVQTVPQTPKPVVPQTPLPVQTVSQTPRPVVPQTPLSVQTVSQTPRPVVPQTPLSVQTVSQTPRPVVPQTPLPVQTVPQTPKQVVPQTPLPVQTVPQTPKQVVPQTPLPVQTVPQTPKQVVPQTPLPVQTVSQTPRPVVPQTPLPVQTVPQTPKPVVPQTPLPVQTVSQTPRQVVPQTPLSVQNPTVISQSYVDALKKEEVKTDIYKDIESAYKDVTNQVEQKTEIKKDKNNNKTMWVNLIKKSNCQALSSDVIDGCKDLTEEIVREMCEIIVQKGNREITTDEIKNYIDKNLKNKETEINTDCVFPPSIFLGMITDVLKTNECHIRPESVFVLQTFVESLLVKMLNGAELVREASKRKRVFATDLLISYQIHKM